MNDPQQLVTVAKQLRELTLGKARKTWRCRIGLHQPMQVPVLDHDKRLRKVFGVSHVKLCKHCAKQL